MKAAKSRTVWAVYFVGFDQTGDDDDSRVEPYVGKERVQTTMDAEQVWYDVSLAVLARGGQLLTVVSDDELHAEALRLAKELEIIPPR